MTIKEIKKSLRSLWTKVRSLSGLLDASKFLLKGICCTAICHCKQIACAQSAPQPKGCGLSKHFDITKNLQNLRDISRVDIAQVAGIAQEQHEKERVIFTDGTDIGIILTAFREDGRIKVKSYFPTPYGTKEGSSSETHTFGERFNSLNNYLSEAGL